MPRMKANAEARRSGLIGSRNPRATSSVIPTRSTQISRSRSSKLFFQRSRTIRLAIRLTAAILVLARGAAPAAAQSEQPDEPTPYRERSFSQQLGERFHPHELTYAAAGSSDATMQFSFKLELLKRGLYFGYTNILLWQIEDSFPLKDINFQPELFWRFNAAPAWQTWLDTGYAHDSNGESGQASRAVDRLFLRLAKELELLDRRLVWTVSAALTLLEGDFNKDRSDYLGFWETVIIVPGLVETRTLRIGIDAKLVSGTNGVPFDRGSITSGLAASLTRYPFSPNFYLQYFSGYGEVLREYNRRRQALRLGLSMNY